MPADALIASMTGFDDLPVPGAVFDLDGRTLAINQAALSLLGRPMGQVLGRRAWDFAPGLDHVWAERVELARVRGQYKDEIVVATPDGIRTIEYVVTVREAGGRPHVLVFALDISRHMEEGASRGHERRLDALGLAAAGIAHDLDRQLVSVLAEARVARADTALGDPAREALRRIEATASQMAELTRQLLGYVSRGRQP